MPRNPDSMDKLYEYLVDLNSTEFIFLSPSFFRQFICPPACGGCCTRFTLDYIEGSSRYKKFINSFTELIPLFTERYYRGVKVLSKIPSHNNYHCEFLSDDTEGRCKIHLCNPFTCDFEPIKVKPDSNYSRKNISHIKLIRKKFGRGWNLLRVDGIRGALCEIEDGTILTEEELIHGIELLNELNFYFQLFFKKRKVELDMVVEYLIDNFDRILNKSSEEPLLQSGIWFPTTPKQLKK